MPLENLPVVTPTDVDTAFAEQLTRFGAALGTAAGVTAANYRLNAPGGFKVQFPLKALTGLDAKPTPTGRASIRLPVIGVAGALLPQPLGFVPPEVLGLHPSVVRRTLGFDAGKKPIVFEASETRVRVYEATREAERIAARVLNTEVVLGRASGFPLFTLPRGQLNITDADLAFLEALPPGTSNAQKLIPDLRARRGDFAVDPQSALGLPSGSSLASAPEPFVPAASVPSASIQTERIRPVNAAALVNEANAEHLARELVHERADP